MADRPAFPDPGTRNVIEAGCSRCQNLVAARTRIAWGNGNPNADVMVVGEAPGAGDPAADRWRGGNLTGLAYTTRHSGRVIRSLFEALGYGPDDCYFTNAVKCFPSDGQTNRAPTTAERTTCFTHLATELIQVDPGVVVATGKQATLAILDREGISLEGFVDSVLNPIDCPRTGVTLLPILHPSYQDIWRSRLGYTAKDYREAIGQALEAALADDASPPGP